MTQPGGPHDPAVAVARLEEQLSATPRSSRPAAHAALRYRLGMALAETPVGERGLNLSKAVRNYDQAAQLFRPGPFPLEYARVQNARGAALRELGQTHDAAAACRRAVALMPGDAPEWERAAALNNLALTLSDLSSHDEAVEVARRAVEAFNRVALIDDRDGEDSQTAPQRAMAVHNHGQVLAAAGRHVAAAAVYRNALTWVDPELLPYQWGLLNHAHGVSLTALAIPDGAVQAFSDALRVFTRTRHPFQHALASNNLGLAWAQVGDVTALRRAVVAFADSLAVLDTRLHRDLWEQAFANLQLAETALVEAGYEADQIEHFVALLAVVSEDERLGLARDRVNRLLSLPEPRRSDALVEIAVAALALAEDQAIIAITATLTVLLELPDEQLLVGLAAQLVAQQHFEDEDQLDDADWVLERALANGMLAPQRLRVRDHLTAMGYERR